MGSAIVRLVALLAIVAATGACSSGPGTPAGVTDGAPAVTETTTVAPGGCDPSDSLSAPSISTDSTKVDATLGVAGFGCGGLNGEGYISFDYNPVLIDGRSSVEISIPDGSAATITWSGDRPFIESSPGRWTTTLGDRSCDRVTIELISAVGTASATFGADIRSGGESVACPQRLVDPSEPGGVVSP